MCSVKLSHMTEEAKLTNESIVLSEYAKAAHLHILSKHLINLRLVTDLEHKNLRMNSREKTESLENFLPNQVRLSFATSRSQ